MISRVIAAGSIIGAIVALIGCSSAGSPPPYASVQAQQSSQVALLGAAQPHRQPPAVVYVSNYDAPSVTTYLQKGYHQSPIGTGYQSLSFPVGLFVDSLKSRHLFVANTGSGDVLEFDPNNSAPINVYLNPGYSQSPRDIVKCPDGTLYAANVSASNGGPGAVTIYKGGSLNLTGYITDSNFYAVFSLACDSASNLYVEYQNQTFATVIGEYGPGGSGGKVLPITISSTPGPLHINRAGDIAVINAALGYQVLEFYHQGSNAPYKTVDPPGHIMWTDFSLSSDESVVWVIDNQRQVVFRVNLQTSQISDTITNFTEPFGIAASPADIPGR